MKILNLIILLVSIYSVLGVTNNTICYYDATSYLRTGMSKMNLTDLDMALNFCSHLVYGFVGIKPYIHEVFSLNVDLDMFHFAEVTALKRKYPKLKVFLSVGGNRDVDEIHPLKYLGLLEAGREGQYNFIDSAIQILRSNDFDGLDLAFQLPCNKPRKVHGTLGTFWKKFKKIFTGNFIVDTKAEEHKKQFTEFSTDLKKAFDRANLLLSLTVLPHVNSTWYFDVQQIKNNFEFINLAAFDFLTPDRNPEEADYTAPIYYSAEQDRFEFYNIEYQVNYWLDNRCPANKLNLGVASYGRAWRLSRDSGLTGVPIVMSTEGAADLGNQSRNDGLISWPDICIKIRNKVNAEYRGPHAPLRKVTDLEQKYGNYAFRPANHDGENGIWISYDDPDFIGIKTNYAKNRGLGGMALFDLSLDDFRGICTGQKYPILRSIRYSL